MASRKPTITIIDDHPEDGAPRFSLGPCRLEVIGPWDLEEDSLERTDLFLVDQRIEDWPEREDCPLGCRPQDGLALAAVLRAHIRQLQKPTATAIALLSANLADLAPVGNTKREHVIASTHGLDWAFAKNADNTAQTASLAAAALVLHTVWPPEDADRARLELTRRILKLKSTSWASLAHSSIAACRPPIHRLSSWTDGMAVLRWLLHRILPYPAFLWSSHQLAVRLGLAHGWLREELSESKTGLSRLLAPCRYHGVLADFLGPRWWGAAVEDLLWRQTDGRSASRRHLHEWLGAKAGPLELAPTQPVIALDEDLVSEEELASSSVCVRIAPEDWPHYAAQAWARKELVKASPPLQALLLDEDRERLDS